MARVAGDAAASAEAGSRLYVARSTSAKIGVAPAWTTALVVAMKESEGTTTSAPGPIPGARRTRCSPVVHDDTATASGCSTAAAKARSNSATRGPWVTQPLRSAATTAASSSAPKNGRLTGITCSPVAHDVVAETGPGVGIGLAEPGKIPTQPLFDFHVGGEAEHRARTLDVGPVAPHVGRPRLGVFRRPVPPDE